MRRVVVVGDGGWGTALSLLVLSTGRTSVGLWSFDAGYATLMRDSRTNPRYLPGFELAEALDIGADLDALLDDADLLVSAVPTAYLRGVWQRHAPTLPRGFRS